MLNNITFEKVEEVIRLWDEARDHPSQRADDPQRGRPSTSDDGVTRAGTPPEPQPEVDWRAAFERYLLDLPDAALVELTGLYRYGHGEFPSLREAAAEPTPIESHQARAGFLSTRTDLADCLRAALARR